jgi:hypothetical protein
MTESWISIFTLLRLLDDQLEFFNGFCETSDRQNVGQRDDSLKFNFQPQSLNCRSYPRQQSEHEFIKLGEYILKIVSILRVGETFRRGIFDIALPSQRQEVTVHVSIVEKCLWVNLPTVRRTDAKPDTFCAKMHESFTHHCFFERDSYSLSDSLRIEGLMWWENLHELEPSAPIRPELLPWIADPRVAFNVSFQSSK